MNDQTALQQLTQLRAMISDAKSVPMSASCMVNRGEALAAVDAAIASLPKELEEAGQVIDARREEVNRGKDEADKLRREAEEWARKTASESEVVSRARQQADEILVQARAEADGLRHEAEAFVETRFAEFEATLARTSSQVRTMRARLAARAPEDTDES